MSHLKLISFVCLIFLSSNLLADNHSVILIKNATIITASDQGTLENTDLLIEDGIIKEIGKNLKTNDGPEIDATGKFVTPGLIAPHTTLGLQEIELEAATRDDSTDHYSAGFSIAKAFNPASSLIPYNRAGGITSAIVTPSSASGIFSGMASAFKINGALMTESIIEDIALIMNLGGNKDSRASTIMSLEESFDVARRFAMKRSSIMRGDDFDFGDYSIRDLEAIQRLLKQEIPLVVRANRVSDLLRMIEIANQYEIRIIFAGAKEAWRIADSIAEESIPVIIDPMDNIPSSFDSIAARLDNAAILEDSGVKVLISSQSDHNSYLSRQGAGNAVTYGLSKEGAIKALTIHVSETFGIADQIGSIEAGKDADIVIWDNDPLEVSSFTTKVLIDGENMSLMTRSKRLRDRYLEKLGLN